MKDVDLQFFAGNSGSEFTHGLKTIDPSPSPSMFGGLSTLVDARENKGYNIGYSKGFLDGQNSKQPEQQLIGALILAGFGLAIAGLYTGGRLVHRKAKAVFAVDSSKTESIPEETKGEEKTTIDISEVLDEAEEKDTK